MELYNIIMRIHKKTWHSKHVSYALRSLSKISLLEAPAFNLILNDHNLNLNEAHKR